MGGRDDASTDPSTGSRMSRAGRGGLEKGYVAQKGERWYAVIYDGLDPLTGRERRRWHPAGVDRAAAEQLARRLAAEVNGGDDGAARSASVPTSPCDWLPGKRLTLRDTTWDGYRRKIERHILPRSDTSRSAGSARHDWRRCTTRSCIQTTAAARSRPRPCSNCISSFAARSTMPFATASSPATSPSSRMRRGCDPSRRSNHNPGPPSSYAHFSVPPPGTGCSRPSGSSRPPACDATRCSGCAGTTSTSTTDHRGQPRDRECRLRTTGNTGQDPQRPRPIDLDPTTIELLRAWRTWQSTGAAAVGLNDCGWVFGDTAGRPVHPHAISQAFERIARRANLPVIRLHDVRHTHATLLIKAGVPVKVVSERLGHATAAFTIETYQHVMPGMQADAATIAESLMDAATTQLLPAATSTGSTRLKRR